MKVLIVDDEPDIIYLLQKRLRSMDWKYLLLTTARRHLRHSAIAMFALSQQTVWYLRWTALPYAAAYVQRLV